jgi:hypothetical protein
MLTRRVDWEILQCSCEFNRLCAQLFPHLCAVYRAKTDKAKCSIEDFTRVFANLIHDYYRVTEYAKGYDEQVCRPILTCLQWDETLPHVDLKGQRGQNAAKRMMADHETGWAKPKKSTRKVDNPFNKTKANIEEKSLEKALLGEALEPNHALRGARAAAEEEEMRRFQEEEKKEDKLRRAVEEKDFNSLMDDMFSGQM